MTQTLTAYIAEVGQALFDLFVQHQQELGLVDVWYGDQSMYPDVPCLAVEPLSTDRAIAGSGLGGNTENNFVIYLMIYHGTLESVQQNRRDADKLAVDVEKLLHNNLQLGGIVVHGFVTKTESGQAQRGEVLAVTRLTWEGLSKTLLGA